MKLVRQQVLGSLLAGLICAHFPLCPRAPSFVPMSPRQIALAARCHRWADGFGQVGARRMARRAARRGSGGLRFDAALRASTSVPQSRRFRTPRNSASLDRCSDAARRRDRRRIPADGDRAYSKNCVARGRVPVFTVGTGLYLRALLEGLADVPQRSEELREATARQQRDHAAGSLASRSCGASIRKRRARSRPADEQKLIRAIEVCLLAKRPLSEVHRSGRIPLEGWRPVKIGLMPPREALYERIHARTDAMLSTAGRTRCALALAAGSPRTRSLSTLSGIASCAPLCGGRMKLEEPAAASSRPRAVTPSAK